MKHVIPHVPSSINTPILPSVEYEENQKINK